jgi:hypothetical protein
MARLLELTGKGASVKFPKESMEIEQLGDLIEVLKRMAANEEERIRADIARNQTNLEILATLQGLIRKQGERKGSPVDFGPLVQILADIKHEREEREDDNGGAYEFDIKRDGRGFAQKIIATPVRPLTH